MADKKQNKNVNTERKRLKYSEFYKRFSGKTVGEVAKTLGVKESTVSEWVKYYREEEMKTLQKLEQKAKGVPLRTSGPCIMMTNSEESRVFRLYEHCSGDVAERIRNVVVLLNMGLVLKMAGMYSSVTTTLEYEDLVMEGYIGLYRAIELYDVSKGYKFSTYATHWIKQAITRHIHDEDSIIRIPVHAGEIVNVVNRERAELEAQGFDKHISDEAILQYIGKNGSSAETIKRAREVKNVVSLSSPVRHEGEEEGTELGDFIASQEMPVEDKVCEEEFKKSVVEWVKSSLSPKEFDIISKRMGFEGKIYTLEEVGKEYNVTRERIRQIEVKAIRKLRRTRSAAKVFDGLRTPEELARMQRRIY